MGTAMDRASHLAWNILLVPRGIRASRAAPVSIETAAGQTRRGRPAGRAAFLRARPVDVDPIPYRAGAIRGSDRASEGVAAATSSPSRCRARAGAATPSSFITASARTSDPAGAGSFSQSEGDWGSEGSLMWFGGCGMASLAALRRGMGLCCSAVVPVRPPQQFISKL
jgi:hypothetical protein